MAPIAVSATTPAMATSTQNLTIGAVLKIANALDVPVGELLALPSPGNKT